jgi:hypothetical protein
MCCSRNSQSLIRNCSLAIIEENDVDNTEKLKNNLVNFSY